MTSRPDRRRRPGAALISTKLAPARAREHVVRESPLERLRAGLERKLTVVCAPAGYGKSTLLAEWRKTLIGQGVQVAWVSFDEEDDNPSTFASYVIAAVMDATGGAGVRAQRQLRDRALLPIHVALGELLNELKESGAPLFLFLDDVDRLESVSIHEALFSLLRYAPDNVHLVLACRSTPALPLSYFTSRDQLVWLDAGQLRFNRQEAAELMRRVAGKELAASDLEALVGATEGWVSGLQLAALALRDDVEAGQVVQRIVQARGGIGAYLKENVMNALPEAVREFLLSTAVLDRMTPALCNALTGNDDAQEMLEWLGVRNLFVKTLDGERMWFCYHALFSQYLRDELQRRRPQTVAALHRAAATWFGAAALWSEAVRHALAAGEIVQAADWVEACAMELIAASDVRTVLNWIANVPEAALKQRVRLRLAHAWAFALSLQIIEARQAIREIELDIEAGRLRVDKVAALELLAVRSLIAGLADESAESLRLGRSVLAAEPQGGSWTEQIGQTTLIFGLSYAGGLDEVLLLRGADDAVAARSEPLYSNVYMRSMSGLGEFVAGRLHDASRTFEAALQIAEQRAGRLCAAAALPAGYLGAIYYEWGDLKRVHELQEDRLPIAIQACSLGPMLRFALTAAMNFALTRDFDAAHSLLRDVERVGRDRQWLRLQVACLSTHVRLSLVEGNLIEAHRFGETLRTLARGIEPRHDGSAVESWLFYEIARGRLLLSDGRVNDAAVALHALQRELSARAMPWYAAQAAVLAALAHDACGEGDVALSLMAHALIYGQQNGLVRTFVDEGSHAAALLTRFRNASARFPDVNAWYLDELHAAFATPCVSAAGEAPAQLSPGLAASNLSAREVEILDYVARGLSNKEIARALRVAPETIKWHLKNIFEKLNVTSRMQAVRRGLAFDMPPGRRGEPVS
jgi:LuxR family maltose regulon positive regulatory protein